MKRLTQKLRNIISVGAVTGLLLAAFPAVALAQNTYGCGEYGRGAYEENCPTTTAEETSETPTVTTVEAPTEDTTPIVLNVYDGFFADTGITITNLEEGDVLSFCLNAGSSGCTSDKEDHHTITIKKIDLSDPNNPVITLTFASSPFDVDLTKDSPKKIDVERDGVNDVEVTFVDVVGDKVVVTIKKLEKPTTNQPVTTTTPKEEDKKSGGSAWLWGGLAGAAVLVIVILLARRATRDKNVTF